MRSNNVKEIILDPMVQTFAKPRHVEDVGRVLQAYADGLSGFQDDYLKAGWREVLQSHKRTTWPMPAEIIDAVRKVRLPDAPQQTIYLPEDDREKWRKIAKQSPFYAEAMDAGAPLYFLNLIAREKRAPRQGDVLKAMQNKDRHIEDVEAAEARAASPATRQAADLGRSIIEKNETMRREAA